MLRYLKQVEQRVYAKVCGDFFCLFQNIFELISRHCSLQPRKKLAVGWLDVHRRNDAVFFQLSFQPTWAAPIASLHAKAAMELGKGEETVCARKTQHLKTSTVIYCLYYIFIHIPYHTMPVTISMCSIFKRLWKSIHTNEILKKYVKVPEMGVENWVSGPDAASQ